MHHYTFKAKGDIMSKGIGQPAKRILFRLYDKSKSLDELSVSGKGRAMRKSDYYVLQRLIEKGLVKKGLVIRSEFKDTKDTYHLTEQGWKLSFELHKEFMNLVREYLDIYPFVKLRRDEKKLLQEYMVDKKNLLRDVVLYDFYSQSCEPCKMLAPNIDALEEEYIESIEVRRIDIGTNSELAKKYNVLAVPTVIIEKDGKVLKRFTGYTGNPFDIINALNEILGVKKEQKGCT